MPLDANNEIESMDPEVRHVSEDLSGRHGLDCRAFATRRADSIEQAHIILVNAIERLPAVAIFHYNLACYICQLGELERAKTTLHTAFKLEPQYRVMALDDDDLKPLWDEIAAA